MSRMAVSTYQTMRVSCQPVKRAGKEGGARERVREGGHMSTYVVSTNRGMGWEWDLFSLLSVSRLQSVSGTSYSLIYFGTAW
jgi:hypothetical protein